MFGLRLTRTFATLEVSAAAYDEIADKLRAVGYDHAFVDGAIDMHGIGLLRAAEPEKPTHRPIAAKKKNSAPGAI